MHLLLRAAKDLSEVVLRFIYFTLCVFLVISRLQSGSSKDSPSEGAGCEVGP